MRPIVRQDPSVGALRRRPPLLPRCRAPGARLPRLVRRERRAELADWSAGGADPVPRTQSAGVGSELSSRSREPSRAGLWERTAGGWDAGEAACTKARTTASTTMDRSRSRCQERSSSMMMALEMMARIPGTLTLPHTGHDSHQKIIGVGSSIGID